MRKLDANAEKVALEKGIIREGESISQVFERVAFNMAQKEESINKYATEFFKIMDNNYFLPNYPTLINGASETGEITSVLSACYVLDIEDSRRSIFNTLSDAVEVQSQGGGTGFNVSKLRPKGSPVRGIANAASGPVSFLKIYDLALGEIIAQAGKRKGANMGILHYTHPDIVEFITVKSDHSLLPNFNLSVLVDDDFIEKANSGGTIALKNPASGEIVGEMAANQLLDLIADKAHKNGCPGLLFYENMNKNNPFPEPLIATNPCGETALYPGECCILGAINLKQVILDNLSDEEFKKIVYLAVRFLDNMIDLNYYPLEKMKEITQKNRKIGLGMMGIADVLFLKRLPYDSTEGRNYVKEWYTKLQEFAVQASEQLAIERGPFPNFENSNFKTPRRNSYITLQQPTGTLSILGECSAGIEPWFGLVQTITTVKGSKLKYINPILQQLLKKKKLWSDSLVEQIEENRGSIKGINSIPVELQEIFVTALDISYQNHILMQATVQDIVDNSVSKTVNMPNNASVEDVKKAFIMAHNLGCKGITIYRDGSKADQPIKITEELKKEEPPKIPKRPKVLQGQTEQINVGECGSIFVTINTQDGEIRETLISKGSSGGCTTAMMEAIGRLISLSRKHKTPVEDIVAQLKNIKCDQVCWDSSDESKKPDKITSCPNAVGLAIQRFLSRSGRAAPQETKPKKCIKCGEHSIMMEGSCEYCRNCGYTKC